MEKIPKPALQQPEKPKPKKPHYQAFSPAEYELADASAIQAVAEGVADEFQQRRAMRWIINNACATYQLPWQPGGPEGARQTDFACGRQFVGQQIVKMTKVNISTLRKKEDDNA